MKKRFILGLVILGVIGIGIVSRPQTSVHAENANVVTVHMDGQVRTIATDAETVQGVLEKVQAGLSQHDKTEPALNEPVQGNDFTINVYRARPITVVDGVNNYTVMTAERSPRQIAEDAGFATKQEDEFHFERSDDPYEGAIGTRMVISRAKTINFDLYGTVSTLSTNETTVAGLLKERAVTLEAGDELNVPAETRITEGMTVSIATVTRSVETVEEEAAFEEERINDAQQPVSYRKVQTPGKNGKKLVTYETVSRNGGAPERKAVKEVITDQPTKQVVVVGAKQIVSAPGNCGEWLAQAGISNADAVWLISKESGCNPGAVNKRSGACGIPQALPCSKLPCPLDATGAVCQLNWMNSYVNGRYGGWAGARAFHAQRGWY